MEEEPNDAVSAVTDREVPKDLLGKLHQANERLHEARLQLEKSMDDSELSHQKGIDQATEEARAAEREVEEISLQIHKSLKPPPDESPPVHC